MQPCRHPPSHPSPQAVAPPSEQHLRERDALLSMAEHSAGIGIWDIDLETEMLRGTPQFWRIMGLPPTETAIPLETTRRLRLPEDRDRVADGFRSILGNHADSFETEYRIRRPDGDVRWIFGRGRLIRDAAGRAVRYSGIDIDVTERKAGEAILAELNRRLEDRVRERTAALEEEIARRVEAEAQLHHAQKLETVGQLTGGIAHDFNNLLTVITGNIEALERSLTPGDERLRRFAAAAIRAVDRAAVLTGQLLAFARRRPSEPRLVDVNSLLRGMSDLLHRTLGEAIEVRMHLAERLDKVFVDPHQLENAILNLAVNARDAMPQGGVLAIETGNTVLAEPESNADRPASPSSCVAIAIRDTGAGMSAEIKKKAFEPFFTTKRVGQGTGLGLPQVHAFTKQSGGLCQLDSEQGAGTTVKLYLPAAREASVVGQAERHPAAAPRGSGEVVLVTEDDADVRACSVELLRGLGYEPLAAPEAETALRILATNPAIQVLFADVGLPGPLDGRRLAEIALLRNPALRVLLTTGYPQEAPREGAGSGVELIAKPFTASGMAEKLKAVLSTGGCCAASAGRSTTG